jgi:hypothetical protein
MADRTFSPLRLSWPGAQTWMPGMKPGMTTQGRSLSRVSVMAGLVPAIYVLRTAQAKKTWMPGIKRGMTTQADCALRTTTTGAALCNQS